MAEEGAAGAMRNVERAVSQNVRAQGIDRNPQVAEIIASFALPFEHPPIRYADCYANSKTTTASPYRRQTLTILETAQPKPYNEAWTFFVFLFRSLLRACIYIDNTIQSCTYKGLFLDTGTGSLTGTLPVTDVDSPLPLVRLQHSSGTEPHGSFLYSGTDARRPGLQFYHLDRIASSSSAIRLIWTDLAGGEDFVVRVWLWNGGEPIEVESQTFTTAGDNEFEYLILAPGEYAVTYQTKGAISEVVVTYETVNSPVCCHLAAFQLEDNQNVIDGAQLISVAGLVMNKTPAAFNGGECAQMQVPMTDNWFDIAGDYAEFSNYAGAVPRTAMKGAYSFLVPQSAQNFNFNDDIKIQNGVIQRMSYKLVNESDYLAYAFQMPAPVLGSTPQFILLATIGIAFRTKDTWRPLKPPMSNAELYEFALSQLRKIPQHYENPTHVAQALKKIRSVVSTVAPYAERYGPAVWNFIKSL
jgi:hypothetical protein